MTIARHYIIKAREGEEAMVKKTLVQLADLVRPTAGCCGVELLHDLDNGHRFIFIEKWENAEAHKSAINPQATKMLSELIPSFDGRPEGAYCEYLKVI